MPARTANFELLNSGMLGMLGNGARLLEDPTHRSRYKDILNPTGYGKLEQMWGLLRHQLQERQFDSHEFDSFARKDFAASFWRWAQAGNVDKTQLGEFRDLINTYQKTLYAAGLSRERFEVPEKGVPVTTGKRASTAPGRAAKISL